MTAAFLAIIAKDVNTLLAYLNNLHFSTITSNEKNFSLLLGTEYNWAGGRGAYIFLHLRQYLLGPVTLDCRIILVERNPRNQVHIWKYTKNICHIKEKRRLWRRRQLSMLGWHLGPPPFTVGVFSYILCSFVLYKSLMVPEWHPSSTKHPTEKLFPSTAHGHVYTGQSHDQNFCPKLCVPVAQNFCWCVF